MKLQLREQLPDEDVERLAGQMLDDSSYDAVIKEDCDVFTPEGNVLLKFRKNVLLSELCAKTFPIWELAATPTDNRGMAAGGGREPRVKEDGTTEKRTRSKEVRSGIVGYMDSNPAFPYCRVTAFTGNEFAKYRECLPLIEHANLLFKELMPERWAVQHEYWKRTNPEFRIGDKEGSFTTVTVNLNFRTATHCDQGDLRQGFGVMAAMRKGNYRGCYTVFPKYRVAFDMQTGDIALADVHQWHSNSPISGIPGTYKRISLVMYYREKIANCKSPEEERLRAIQKTEAVYARQDQGTLL